MIIIIITLISFENSEKPEWRYKNQHQIFRLPSPAATPQPHTIMGNMLFNIRYKYSNFNQMFDMVSNSSL